MHITDWRDEAMASLAPHLHPAVQAVAAALATVSRPAPRWPSGREHIFEAELLSRVSDMGPEGVPEDRVLSGVDRLLTLRWLSWEKRDGGVALVASAPPKLSLVAPGTPRLIRSRGSISKRRRLEVYLRDGWECWLCGLPVDPPAGDEVSSRWEASVDHVVPHCEGGSDAVENLRTAHRWCNSARGPRAIPDRRVMRTRVILMQADEYATSMAAS